MRTLKQLPVAQDRNLSKFPDGQIQNKTASQSGTPVVREVYGDLLTNVYAILRDSGIVPNGSEDSSETVYQLLDAFKKFHNVLNDLEQVLTVQGSGISVNFNMDSLPFGYVFIGLTSSLIEAGKTYNLSGEGNASWFVSSDSNIEPSSIVLVSIKENNSTIYSISNKTAANNDIQVSFGSPLSFNSSKDVLYFSEGFVFNNYPESFNVGNIIAVSENNLNLKTVDAIAFKGKLLCLVLDTALLIYKVFCFDLNDLENVESEVFFPSNIGVDNQIYWYCDGNSIYVSNSTNISSNNVVDDNEFVRMNFNEETFQMSITSDVTLDSSFVKSTNAFITDTGLFTLINSELYKYELDGSGTREFLGNFKTLNGQVFKLQGESYYSNGETAIKWAF